MPWSDVHEALDRMPAPKSYRDAVHDVGAHLFAMARSPPFYWQYPRTGREESRTQQRVQDMCEQTSERYFKDNPINYAKVGKAAVNVPILKIARAFRALMKRREKVKDPTAFLVAEIRPRRVNHDTLGPIVSDPRLLSSLINRLTWMNKAGGFDGQLNKDKILWAAAGTGASMRTMNSVLGELQLKKEDPVGSTDWVIGVLIKRMRKYAELDSAAAEGQSDPDDERAARFEEANAPLVGASDARKASSRADAAAESETLGSDEDQM